MLRMILKYLLTPNQKQLMIFQRNRLPAIGDNTSSDDIDNSSDEEGANHARDKKIKEFMKSIIRGFEPAD